MDLNTEPFLLCLIGVAFSYMPAPCLFTKKPRQYDSNAEATTFFIVYGLRLTP